MFGVMIHTGVIQLYKLHYAIMILVLKALFCVRCGIKLKFVMFRKFLLVGHLSIGGNFSKFDS